MPADHFALAQEPYGACVVYKKDKALIVGLYPEYVTYAGEDTLSYKYSKVSTHWVLNKKAVLWWDHPVSYELMREKVCLIIL